MLRCGGLIYWRRVISSLWVPENIHDLEKPQTEVQSNAVITEAYFAFCESELWRPWIAQRLIVPLSFDADAAPEPYVSFSSGTTPLVALTTNPGATMPHQTRAAVQIGDGPLSEADEFVEAARKLGRFYEQELAGRPAGRRISGLRNLSCLLGNDGVLQVEACPFHSASLPGKNAFLREAEENELLTRYHEFLARFLRNSPVVIIQASAKPECPTSPWLKWITKLGGLDLNAAEFVPLVGKGSKTTVGAWVSRHTPKALVLAIGGNNLPGDEGLRKLAARLRETRR